MKTKELYVAPQVEFVELSVENKICTGSNSGSSGDNGNPSEEPW